MKRLIFRLCVISMLISCGKDTDVLQGLIDKAPDTPTNISIENLTFESVTLKWNTAKDDFGIDGYNIVRNNSEPVFVKDTIHQIIDLSPASTYEVTLTSIDISGNLSLPSDPIVFETLPEIDIEQPTVPTGLQASNISSTALDLSWSEATDNVSVTGYIIYQDDAQIGTATGTSFSVSELNPSTTYLFKVAATDAAGNTSNASQTLEVTTISTNDSEPPSIPTGLLASNISSTALDLSWNAATDNVGVTGYIVYQDDTQIGTATGTSFSVSGLNPSTTYLFKVAATDVAGNTSNASQTLEATTEGTNQSMPKVLVFTKTSGFDHNTREECATMVQNIGSELGFDVTIDATGDEFNSTSNLNSYNLIFFSNTSGNMLNVSQRNNVESYAAQGGNFISNHAASDAYGHSTATSVSGNGKGVWDWYAENVTGCSVRNSPNHTSANFNASVSIQNNNTQLTKSISFPWEDNEEWYYWEDGYINSSFTELLRVSSTGSNSYDAARMTSQYWIRADGGKSFYTSMGHSENKYSDNDFIQLIKNAIEYML